MRVSQIIAFAAGPAVNALLGLVALPLIAWLFTPEDVGRMSMLYVALSFCIMFCSLGLDQAYVREYHAEKYRGALLKQVILPGLIVLLLTCISFSLSPGSLTLVLLGYRNTPLSLLIMAVMFCAFLNRFLSLSLRMQERGLAFSMNQLVPRLVMLCLLGGSSILYSRHTLLQLISAWALGMMVATALLIWLTRGDWHTPFRRTEATVRLRDMLKFGLPLIPGGLAFWAATTADRIFVRIYAGFDQLALFSVAISIAGVAGILQTIFTTVWTPVIYRRAEATEEVTDIVTRMTRWMTVVVVCLFSVTGLLSWSVRYLLPADYAGIKYILVACLGFPLLLTFSEVTSVGIGLRRKTIYLLLTSALTLGVNVFLNAILVPGAGAGGAAAATCLSFWFFLVIRTEFSRRVWEKTPRYEAYLFTLLCVCAAAMLSLAGDSTERGLVGIWVALLVSVLFRHRHFIRSEILHLRQRKSGRRKSFLHD
jgi:O-antigen/teichoic acid export membrane protein